ncbi:MAG: Transcription antitermination protein NusB [Eubacteriales bacterium SKADARSKE-1]|nr:Transcription antitermination protein NusB [Eubacteriales bacterium SKADARSKE-1]
MFRAKGCHFCVALKRYLSDGFFNNLIVALIKQFLFGDEFLNRRKEREKAFLFLFENSFNNYSLDEIIEAKNHDEKEKFEQPGEFAKRLFLGVKENEEKIDGLINKNSIGWQKSRISKIALAILRLATYEIMFCEDIPDSVSINEAVELAKKYGMSEESAFINGILGSICKDKNKDE